MLREHAAWCLRAAGVCVPPFCVCVSVKNGGIPGLRASETPRVPRTRPVGRIQTSAHWGERVSGEHARNVYHACQPGSCGQTCKEAADQVVTLSSPTVARCTSFTLRYTNFLATMLHCCVGLIVERET
jgi:hypothetical protein